MDDVLKEIGTIGIAPAVKIGDVEDAALLAKTLREGGLPCVEITFRTDMVEEAIRAITKAYPEILVGAGTVLAVKQVGKAVMAGATFIISPGLNSKMMKHCVGKGIPIAPGVSDASDTEQAIKLDLNVVEFFPAEQAGGLAMTKALAAPYVKIKLMPTDGINAKNLNGYLAYNKILVCGGSWMVKPELISAGEFDKVRDMTHEAVQIMLGFEFGYIGINTEDAAETDELTDAFSDIFDFTKKEGSNFSFVSVVIEIMKYKDSGDHGHLSINTDSLPRAISYFKNHGTEFDPGSARYDDKGNMTIVYFKHDSCGFGVHLAQKE